MNDESRISTNGNQAKGSVWHELRFEREEICEALLSPSKALAGFVPAIKLEQGSNELVQNHLLQARLRLIDEALDRLMTGTYGDCVVCGRWIEDRKLHADAAFPFCLACEKTRNNCPSSMRMNMARRLDGSKSNAACGISLNR